MILRYLFCISMLAIATSGRGSLLPEEECIALKQRMEEAKARSAERGEEVEALCEESMRFAEEYQDPELEALLEETRRKMQETK